MSKYITVYFVGSISTPATIEVSHRGDGLMVFYNDSTQGINSFWTSSTYYLNNGLNILGSELNPYDSGNLVTGNPLQFPTNPCKDAQPPEVQFSVKVAGATNQIVRLSIELSNDFENYISNPTDCNINKIYINNLGNINSKKLSELGTSTQFSLVEISCSFFDPVDFFYHSPFVTNLPLANAGKITLLEYQIGSPLALVPLNEDVSPISSLIDTDIMFTIRLEKLQISGNNINWLSGNYSLSVDVTAELLT